MAASTERAVLLEKMRLEMENTRNRIKAVRQNQEGSQKEEVEVNVSSPCVKSATPKDPPQRTAKIQDFLTAANEITKLRQNKAHEHLEVNPNLSRALPPSTRINNLQELQKAIEEKRLQRLQNKPLTASPTPKKVIPEKSNNETQYSRPAFVLQLDQFMESLRQFEDTISSHRSLQNIEQGKTDENTEESDADQDKDEQDSDEQQIESFLPEYSNESEDEDEDEDEYEEYEDFEETTTHEEEILQNEVPKKEENKLVPSSKQAAEDDDDEESDDSYDESASDNDDYVGSDSEEGSFDFSPRTPKGLNIEAISSKPISNLLGENQKKASPRVQGQTKPQSSIRQQPSISKIQPQANQEPQNQDEKLLVPLLPSTIGGSGSKIKHHTAGSRDVNIKLSSRIKQTPKLVQPGSDAPNGDFPTPKLETVNKSQTPRARADSGKSSRSNTPRLEPLGSSRVGDQAGKSRLVGSRFIRASTILAEPANLLTDLKAAVAIAANSVPNNAPTSTNESRESNTSSDASGSLVDSSGQSANAVISSDNTGINTREKTEIASVPTTAVPTNIVTTKTQDSTTMSPVVEKKIAFALSPQSKGSPIATIRAHSKSSNPRNTVAFTTSPFAFLPPNIEKVDSFRRPLSTYNLKSLDKRETMRLKVIDELIATEQDYINDLMLTSKQFYMPLKERRLLKDNQISVLFSNMTMLLGISVELLAELDKDPSYEHIGTTFCWMSDFLKMYSEYCTNQPEAFRMVDECVKKNVRFESFLKERLNDPECRGLQLNGFLIKPVQRVMKYPLFLKELIKYTDTSSPDYSNLQEALSRAENILTVINENQRAQENRIKVLEIRKLLNIGEQIIHLNKHKFLLEDIVKEAVPTTKDNQTLKMQNATYFLFSEFLIRAKGRKDRMGFKKKLSVIATVPLELMIGLRNVADDVNNPEVVNAFLLLYKDPKTAAQTSFLVIASSPDMKKNWILQVAKAKAELNNADTK